MINELARMAHLNVGHVIRVGLKSIGRGSSVCSWSVSTNQTTQKTDIDGDEQARRVKETITVTV